MMCRCCHLMGNWHTGELLSQWAAGLLLQFPLWQQLPKLWVYPGHLFVLKWQWNVHRRMPKRWSESAVWNVTSAFVLNSWSLALDARGAFSASNVQQTQLP